MWKIFKRKPQTTQIGNNIRFPDFDFSANQLSEFSYMDGLFIVTLKNERVTYHTTDNAKAFYKWLTDNNIRDVKSRIGFGSSL